MFSRALYVHLIIMRNRGRDGTLHLIVAVQLIFANRGPGIIINGKQRARCMCLGICTKYLTTTTRIGGIRKHKRKTTILKLALP